MSLLHWWPLNGNLNNKGISNVSLTNNGATINSSGKIGSCYYFNSTILNSSALDLSSCSTGCSLAIWAKIPTSQSAWSQLFILGTSGTTWNNIRVGIDINSSGIPYFNISNGSSNTNINSGTAIKDGIWHHICGTYDGTNLNLYIDGVLVKTGTTSYVPALSSVYIYIGGNAAGEKFIAGYLNDARIYDHALSAKEVKEISKGLVLHYTFEDDSNISPNIFDIENYLSSAHGMNNGTKATYSTSGFTITATGTDMYIEGMCYSLGATANAAWHLMPVTEGKTYRISYDLVAGANLSKSYLCYFNSSRVCVGASPYTGFSFIRNGTTNTYYYDFTVPTGYSISSVSFRLGKAGSSGEVITAEHWQLRNTTEFIPYSSANFSTPLVIYDSSGYGNNGTVNGNLQISSDSMSGQYSIYSPAGANYVEKQGFPVDGFNADQQFTINTWIKIAGYVGSSWNTIFRLAANNATDTQMHLCYNSSGKIILSQYSDDPQYDTSVALNTWAMVTWVHYKDGSTAKCKYYVNGQQIGDIKSYSGLINIQDNARLTLFYDSIRNAYDANLSIADFKIFATALSADDVKAEYSRKAAIDKNGNLFTGEFVETVVNADITKKNQVKADAFQEEGTKVQIFGGYTRLDSLDMPGPAAGATSQHNTIQQLSISYDTIEAEVLRIGKGTSGAILISGGWYVNFSANPMQIKNTTGVITPTVLPENVWTKVTLTFDTAPTSLKLATWSDATNYWTAQHSEYLYLKAYKNGALVLHLVPVKRNRDNVLGLYDLVAHKFYTNTGTGSFIAGTELGGFSAVKANQLYEI